MATQLPISTISYNTVDFLKKKLEQWYHEHLIRAYMFIFHKGEDGDKDHIHLRIEPNKRLDPMDLMDELCMEVDPNDRSKNLGCRPWRPSKEEDWFLYVVHDKKYLDFKYGGGERGEKLPYCWDEIQVAQFYDLEIAWIRAKAYLEHTSCNMVDKLMQGISPMSLIRQGENVHTVNALIQALSNNDYLRIAIELKSVKRLIEQVGFTLGYEDNKVKYLVKDTGEKIELVLGVKNDKVEELPFSKGD